MIMIFESLRPFAFGYFSCELGKVLGTQDRHDYWNLLYPYVSSNPLAPYIFLTLNEQVMIIMVIQFIESFFFLLSLHITPRTLHNAIRSFIYAINLLDFQFNLSYH